MRKNRLISIIILGVFLLSLIPAGVFAQDSKPKLGADLLLDYAVGSYLSYKWRSDDPLFGGDYSKYEDPDSFVDIVLADINREIEETYGVINYYPKEIIGPDGKTHKINPNLLRDRRIIAYGDPEKIPTTNPRSKEGYLPYLGYGVEGETISNPRWWHPDPNRRTSPKQFEPSNMIWDTSESAEIYLAQQKISTEHNIHYTIAPSHGASKIAATLNSNSFSYGKTSVDLSYHIALSTVLINFIEGGSAGKEFFNDYGISYPDAKRFWTATQFVELSDIAQSMMSMAEKLADDYAQGHHPLHQDIHIVNPPTKHSWGHGYAFMRDPANVYVFRTIMIAPLIDLEDIIDLPIVKTVDLEADTPKPNVIVAGEKYTGTATFVLEKPEDEPIDAKTRGKTKGTVPVVYVVYWGTPALSHRTINTSF